MVSEVFGRRGFNLIEVMFASGIAALGLLTLLGALLSVHRASLKSALGESAQALCDQMLERTVREVARRDNDPFWSLASGQTWKEGSSTEGTTEFHYQVKATEVLDTLTAAPLGVATGATDNTVRRIDVSVWWWGEQAANRHGYGKLQVSACRLVNRTRIPD